MNCYHCAKTDYRAERMNYQITAAVGVCQQCGEAVCVQHAVKSDIPLPDNEHAAMELAHPVLLPLLCADCYQELAALAAVRA